MGTMTMNDVVQCGCGIAFGFAIVIISGQLADKHPEFKTFGVIGVIFASIGFIIFMYKFFKKDKPITESKNPHGTLPKGFSTESQGSNEE